MADEEACEKKIGQYGIFFRRLHVYKKRTKLKTYYLQDTDNVWDDMPDIVLDWLLKLF